MRSRYVIGGILAIAFLVVGYLALDSSSIEYADLSRAEKLGKTVQVVGTWDQDGGSSYDAASNIFRFRMKDEHGVAIKVELAGPKPNNFEIAESIVVKGRVENGTFHATTVLTKCPSKYEGNASDLKGS
jgi:cytochrome c-type biogenesis protein CcmE